MPIAEAGSEITYRPLNGCHAQAADAIEQALVAWKPSLLEDGVIIPKGEAGYKKAFSDPSYSFLGAFKGDKLIGYQGCHYFPPHEEPDLRHLMGEQFVSRFDDIKGYTISEHPLPIPRLADAQGPAGMLITLRLHPDHHKKHKPPTNGPKRPSIATELNTQLTKEALDREASHIMVDMALENRTVFELQRKSAEAFGMSVCLFGAAHDMAGPKPTPSITAVVTREPYPPNTVPVKIMAIDNVMRKVESGTDHIGFMKLSAMLNGGFVGLPVGNEFHFVERPLHFHPAKNKLSRFDATCL